MHSPCIKDKNKSTAFVMEVNCKLETSSVHDSVSFSDSKRST